MSSAIASTNLTDKQKDFVRLYVQGYSATKAARLAAYSDPRVDGWRVRQAPAVQAAIVQETRRAIVAAAPMALKLLRRAVMMKDAPWTVRVSAAKTLLDYVPKAGTGEDGKPLDGLRKDDLSALVARLEAADRSHNAKLIEQPSTLDIIDILEG